MYPPGLLKVKYPPPPSCPPFFTPFALVCDWEFFSILFCISSSLHLALHVANLRDSCHILKLWVWTRSIAQDLNGIHGTCHKVVYLVDWRECLLNKYSSQKVGMVGDMLFNYGESLFPHISKGCSCLEVLATRSDLYFFKLSNFKKLIQTTVVNCGKESNIMWVDLNVSVLDWM